MLIVVVTIVVFITSTLSFDSGGAQRFDSVIRSIQYLSKTLFDRNLRLPAQQLLHTGGIAISRLNSDRAIDDGLQARGAPVQLDEETCGFQKRRELSGADIHAGSVVNT